MMGEGGVPLGLDAVQVLQLENELVVLFQEVKMAPATETQRTLMYFGTRHNGCWFTLANYFTKTVKTNSIQHW